MFQQTFVDAQPQPAKPYTLLVSLLFQVATVAVLVIVPLLYTQALPNAQLRSMLTAPAPPVHSVRPKQVAVDRPRTVVTPTRPLLSGLIAPRVIPKRIAAINDAVAAPDISLAGGTADGNASSDASWFVNVAPHQPLPPAPAATPASNRPVRVGGQVAEANLVRRVEPAYPALARSVRVQGSVEFTALISKDGHVENLQLVRGHPLLIDAAKSAILQWRYRPTLLNGHAVEVTTSITVNFTLSQ